MGTPDTAKRPAQPTARVDGQACDLCGACLAVCPVEAIKLGDEAVEIDAEACCGCGACVEVCPNDAISLT
jgi:dihydropyrimidine dehydrogenase (NAD+) subunit PreA